MTRILAFCSTVFRPGESKGAKDYREPVEAGTACRGTSIPAEAAFSSALEILMETRPYFVLGDIASNGGVGALVGVTCAWLFPSEWHMAVTMIAGMIFGMVMSLPMAFLLSGLFGAMETLLPVMTTGMVAGMVVTMQSSLTTMRPEETARIGASCGLAVVIVTYLANAFIRRRATRWTT